MKKYIYFLFILTIPASGCTFYKVDANEIVVAPSQKFQTAHEVQYLENVTVPYDVIGHVTVNTERRNSKEEVIEKMKRQVAVLGGDAVTNVVQTDKPSPITHVRTIYTGTVIVLKEPQSQAKPAEPMTPAVHETENLK